MADIKLWGATFPDVPKVLLPTATDGTAEFYEVSGSQTVTDNGTYDVKSLSEIIVDVSGGGGAVIEPLSVTENGTYTAPSGVDGYSPVTVNVAGGGGGGGGIGTLLATQSLGYVSVTSTNATDLGITVTVNGVNDYDLLIVQTTIDDYTAIYGLHATTAFVGLVGETNVSTKNKATIANLKQNLITNSTKTIRKTNQNTTVYGIYPYSVSISSGTATIKMYGRYSSSYTDTIKGDYTTRVYGIKLYHDYY